MGPAPAERAGRLAPSHRVDPPPRETLTPRAFSALTPVAESGYGSGHEYPTRGARRPRRGGTMIKRLTRIALAVALAAGLAPWGGTAQAQGTIKIAYTDPLSGPFAQVGDQNLQQFKYIIDWMNARGGALGKKFELVAFDNKSQPSDALLALKSATDQNMPIIMQCSGSNIAAALIEAVDKHNERNPDNRIVYVNCGAVATELTNEKCSYWHFRMDAHVGMKAEPMAHALPKEDRKSVVRVREVG